MAILQSISSCITLLLLYLKKFKNYLNFQHVGTNPVMKQIIDVIKYSYHQKYPVRRSALSYYLNTYPSKIDFGKVQYGGPFTNEEVEDTKTVLRLSDRKSNEICTHSTSLFFKLCINVIYISYDFSKLSAFL